MASAAPNFSLSSHYRRGKINCLAWFGLGRFQLLPTEMLILTFWGVGSSPSTNHQCQGVGWGGSCPPSQPVSFAEPPPQDLPGEGGELGAGRGQWVRVGDIQDTQHWGRREPWAVLAHVPGL